MHSRSRILPVVSFGAIVAVAANGCATSGDASTQAPGEDAGALPDGGNIAPDAVAESSALDARADVAEDAGCPPGFVDLVGHCDYQCTPTANAPADPIDATYTDDNCDGSDGVVAKCLYVAADGTDSPAGGTRTAPLKTIAYALPIAKTKAFDVCLGGDTFAESIALVAGVNVYGGFEERNASFPWRRTSAATTTLQAQGTVVLADAIDADTIVAGLTIHALTPDLPNAGKGTYGIRHVKGTASLFVKLNIITTDAAQQGADGVAGSGGANGNDGNPGQNGCNACCGGGGGGPAPGSPCGGAAGGYGGAGACDENDGQPGGGGSGTSSGGGAGGGAGHCNIFGTTNKAGGGANGGGPFELGASGANGAPPAQQAGALALDGSYPPPLAGSGNRGNPGNAGGGAGGGGGGSGYAACRADKGGGGSGGTGGCGGSGGSGGQSGGASFGIVARAGKIVIAANVISAARGGTGGAGRPGGAGGAGGFGAGGGGGQDDSGPGGTGGRGSSGGSGGAGAGGAGGPCACIAIASAATFDDTVAPNACTTNGGGAGGAGGAGNGGPAGVSGKTLQLP